MQIDLNYDLYTIKQSELEAFFQMLSSGKINGVNVTIPYKKIVIDYLDDISEIAKRAKSVNTITVTENGLYGDNTDYFGFGEMLKYHEIDVKSKNVVVLGTGGAARTVALWLLDNQASEVVLVSRNVEEKKVECSDFNVIGYDELPERKKDDILINATPVGMYQNVHECPINENLVCGYETVVDLIYNPYITKLIDVAQKNRANSINGLYMLVAQAVKAQSIWNDYNIAEPVIDKIYEDMKDVCYAKL